jgi:hypothetical protein
VYDGTVATLMIPNGRNSPYRGLAQNTQRGYDDWCRTLERAIGKRRVDRLNGQDLRYCFLALLQPATPRGAPRVRLAKACVRSMLSILLSYGAELRLPGCLELSQVDAEGLQGRTAGMDLSAPDQGSDDVRARGRDRSRGSTTRNAPSPVGGARCCRANRCHRRMAET